MSLINCPECNKEVSDKAYSCPYCGFPIEEIFDETDSENISEKEIKVEFDLDEDDSLTITNVNGVLVDLGKLLESNYYEINTAARTLNSITKVGIVVAKNMVTEFIEKNPEYDKKSEFKEFINEQANLTRMFKCNQKIGKLFIDHENQLFSIGFWSYIYKFSDIKNVIIKDDMKLKISIIIDMDHINTPQIQINMPITKDIKSLRSLRFSKFILSREESLDRARKVKEVIEELKLQGLKKVQGEIQERNNYE